MRESEAGFDAFVGRSWGRLYAQAFVLTASRELAEDLTQEALLRTWKHWDRVAGYDDPEGWTRRVLHNLCIESWRRARPRRWVSDHELEASSELSDHHLQLAQAMRSLPASRPGHYSSTTVSACRWSRPPRTWVCPRGR